MESRATIYVVSDGRGETCDKYLRAALVQFDDQEYEVVREAEVRSSDRVARIVEEAARVDAVIFYTLVGAETRQAMRDAAARHPVPTVDVLGPAFRALRDAFKSPRQSTPGLLHEAEREQLERHDAIDYTLTHDDGQRASELQQAHVVLVGISRTCKSATCFYLAYRGIKAANVPLVPDLPPPPELLALDPEMVIGLRMNPDRLRNVRSVRAKSMALNECSPYLEKLAIGREIIEANRLMQRCGWRTLDVSYMAIEEVAREIVSMRGFAAQP